MTCGSKRAKTLTRAQLNDPQALRAALADQWHDYLAARDWALAADARRQEMEQIARSLAHCDICYEQALWRDDDAS